MQTYIRLLAMLIYVFTQLTIGSHSLGKYSSPFNEMHISALLFVLISQLLSQKTVALHLCLNS